MKLRGGSMRQADLFDRISPRQESAAPSYYVVYEANGRQCGHVSVADIERERELHPDLQYEMAERTNAFVAREAAAADDRPLERSDV